MIEFHKDPISSFAQDSSFWLRLAKIACLKLKMVWKQKKKARQPIIYFFHLQNRSALPVEQLYCPYPYFKDSLMLDARLEKRDYIRLHS